MRRSSGFTLIELLVVVAIIAILAAILFPTFARAKKEAHKVQCIANLHQLFIAVGQYSNDYDNDLPTMIMPWHWDTDSDRTNYWNFFMHIQLAPYIKDSGICSCPAWKAIERHPATAAAAQLSPYSWGPNGYSWALPPPYGTDYHNYPFAYPANLAWPTPGTPRQLSALKQPTKYVFMYCNTMNDHSGYGDREIAGNGAVTNNLACLCIHGDGHTELIRFSATSLDDFNDPTHKARAWELWWNGGYADTEHAFADSL